MLIGTKGVFILHVVNLGVNNNVHAQVHVKCQASHLSSPIIDVKKKFKKKNLCPCMKVPNFTKIITNPCPPCLTYMVSFKCPVPRVCLKVDEPQLSLYTVSPW